MFMWYVLKHIWGLQRRTVPTFLLFIFPSHREVCWSCSSLSDFPWFWFILLFSRVILPVTFPSSTLTQPVFLISISCLLSLSRALPSQSPITLLFLSSVTNLLWWHRCSVCLFVPECVCRRLLCLCSEHQHLMKLCSGHVSEILVCNKMLSDNLQIFVEEFSFNLWTGEWASNEWTVSPGSIWSTDHPPFDLNSWILELGRASSRARPSLYHGYSNITYI